MEDQRRQNNNKRAKSIQKMKTKQCEVARAWVSLLIKTYTLFEISGFGSTFVLPNHSQTLKNELLLQISHLPYTHVKFWILVGCNIVITND